MSRLIYLTKNYLKLILRSKAMIIITLIGTILVIAALSNTFKVLLDQAEKDAEFTVGYKMTDESRYSFVEDQLIDGFKDQGVTLKRYEDEDPEKLIKSGDIEVFIDFSDDSYTLMGDKQSEIDTRIVQYVLYNTDKAMNGEFGSVDVSTGTLDAPEMPDATIYYSLVQMVYFLSLCSLFLTMVFYHERKSNIGIRFKSSGASGAVIYLGKLASCVITSWIAQVFIIAGSIVMIFDVDFGKPLVAIPLLMLATIAFCSFGMLFYIMFKNVAASIGVLFTVIWAFGMMGGTFETYMYSSFSDSVKRSSPFYYINRTLVETATTGKSDYLMPCIVVLIIMIAVSVSLGILISSKKKEV